MSLADVRAWRRTAAPAAPRSATAPTALAVSGTRAARAIVAGLVTADAAVISLMAVLAVFGRVRLEVFADSPDVVDLVAPLGGVLILAWIAALALAGSYDPTHAGAGMTEYHRVARSSFALAAAVGIAGYLTQYPLSRGFYLLFFGVGIPVLLLERFLLRRLIHRARSQGRLRTPVLIAGDLDHIDDIAIVLDRESWLGYELVGALSTTTSELATLTGLPILGTPENAAAVVRTSGAQIVIFTEGSFRRGRDFNLLARTLEDTDASLVIVPSLTDVSAQRMEIRPVAGIPLVHVERPRAQHAARWRKRAFDIVGTTLILLVAAPVMAVVALAVRLGDHGPILFSQQRAGRKGTPFRFYKFRSMVIDAEARLAEVAALNQNDGVMFKAARDPRVTRVGRVIRRYSLDELPQLVNVLRGDMSLVGPRPALLHEVSQYEKHVLRRLDVRPGLTGLWQVSGRSDLSWEDTVRLDLYYVDNWSMMQDLAILFRTLNAVVGRHGAY